MTTARGRLSSPRAKRAGPKGLRAESARAVTGRRNDQIWPKIGIFGQFGPGHAGLFNALLWVGWWLWRAGCISQDTYLLYIDRHGGKYDKCNGEDDDCD